MMPLRIFVADTIGPLSIAPATRPVRHRVMGGHACRRARQLREAEPQLWVPVILTLGSSQRVRPIRLAIARCRFRWSRRGKHICLCQYPNYELHADRGDRIWAGQGQVLVVRPAARFSYATRRNTCGLPATRRTISLRRPGCLRRFGPARRPCRLTFPV